VARVRALNKGTNQVFRATLKQISHVTNLTNVYPKHVRMLSGTQWIVKSETRMAAPVSFSRWSGSVRLRFDSRRVAAARIDMAHSMTLMMAVPGHSYCPRSIF
jgi:hypothetical protein